MAEVVKHLSSKCEALHSILSTTKKKKKEKRNIYNNRKTISHRVTLAGQKIS
jgi:hypothetical protein